MGEWDHVRKIMEEEGDIAFWKMRIRPGGPPPVSYTHLTLPTICSV